ncbi:MAG: ComEC/Rec2 family competence protein [Pararhodobacter sp.]
MQHAASGGAGARLWRAVSGRAARTLGQARGHLFPFAPVCLGLGIGGYFALPAEPPAAALWALALAALVASVAALRGPEGARPLVWALALCAAGVALAGARAQAVAAPVLAWHRYGPVEGRIVLVDRSESGAVRLTLDQVVLPGVPPDETPARVRLSVHGGPLDVDPVAGRRVAMTGHLGPPGDPVEPGGFDFRRLAWFDGLGAVGYTRTPVLALGAPEPGIALAITRWRQSISAGIRARLPGETGGFVAAILTGDRSGVGLETIEALRRSNLAHLLAISGLHMGLLTGVVYGALRALLALFPPLALRLPIRKLAAIGALAAAAAYLALSGGNVATQRAFIMVAVMLGAVIADRRAISMRSVALAALIVLVWRPEAILSAGFQMSFAATIALVGVFGVLRDRRKGRERREKPGLARRLADPVLGAALCSLVAGVATAPIAAAQFHRIADYGLIANILSVPLMGVLVMPAAVLAAVLWPLGGAGLGLWLMEAGTRWILGVAHWIAGVEGAVSAVPAPPGWVLPALGLGGAWLALWPGRARWAGAAVLALAFGAWSQTGRPGLLIDREGALIGLMTPEGRVLSRARGAGYAADAWLEADGDAVSQAVAAARPGLQPVEGGVRFAYAGGVWVHLHGRAGERALPGACQQGVTVILDRAAPDGVTGPCRLLDARALGRTGALAIAADGSETGAADRAGQRPWTGAP